jgi:muramoyltetrapeptide carboxypeptidase
MYRKPRRMKSGDRFGIFLPSSPVKEPFRSNGIQALTELGFQTREVRNVFERHGFLARPSERAMADIQSFFDDETIGGLWAGRGGYGSNYLLPHLADLSMPTPKVVIGSSDVSYLLWYLLDRFRLVVFYGPMAYASLAEGKFNRENLMRTLTGDYSELKIKGAVLRGGDAAGIVTGGCLSNLVSLIGTLFFPVVEDRILLLEDLNERPYKLDRMFWQLAQYGIFDRIKALILGEFPGCFLDESEKSDFLSGVRSLTEKRGIPVLYDLPFGHSADGHVLPLGIKVEISPAVFPGLLIREKGVMR